MAYDSLLLGLAPQQPVVRRLAESALLYSGAGRLGRWRLRRSLTILMYHRFNWIENAGMHLDRQFQFLRRHFTPLSLGDAARRLRQGEPLPARAICITVDDGHADFRDVAAPALARYDLPATLFVTTDFVDGLDWLWFDQIEHAIRITQSSVMANPLTDELLALGTLAERQLAFSAVLAQAKKLPDQMRRALPRLVADALEVTLPRTPPHDYAAVSWDDLRAMPMVDVGVHTRSHPILAQVESAERLEDEIAGAKQRIESMLGRPAETFCYPNGQPEDFTPGIREIVRRSGISAAVTTVRARAIRGTDLLQLPRIGIGPELPQSYFERLVSGLAS